MKWFPWNNHEDYAIRCEAGSKGRWRWQIVHKGDTVALSPVRGWVTAEEARDAARAFLNGIVADHLAMQEGTDE